MAQTLSQNPPQVTVIIPTYNTPQSDLIKTIDSVLSQTYNDFELIIVDDGSKTPFNDVQHLYTDQRIVYLKNQQNLGLAKTRNHGIKKGKALFITFLDAGDYWLPSKLEKQMQLVHSNKDVDMVFCGARFVVPGMITYDLYPVKKNDWHKALLIGQPITGSASAVLVKAEVCRNLGGFYTKEDLQQDRELWLRIAKEYQIDFVNEILTVIEVLADSLGSDPFKKEITYRRFIDLHIDEMKKKGVYNKSLALYHSSISHLYFRRGITLKGMKHIIISLVLWPRRSRLKRLYYYLHALLTGSSYMERVSRSENNKNIVEIGKTSPLSPLLKGKKQV